MEKQTWKNTVILLLSIALVLSLTALVFIINKKESTPTGKPEAAIEPQVIDIGPVDEGEARVNVDLFRANSLGYGIYYTREELSYYVDTVYPLIRDAQIRHMTANGTDPNNYDWKIGCYFMYNKNGQKTVQDFCFIPLAVNK